MITSLENRLDTLNKKLEKLLADMEMKPDNRNRKPLDAWSPNQVLYHLYISESGTVQYLNKKILAGDVPKSGLKSLIASRLLKKALKNDQKKYKAPKGVGDIPDNIDYAKLKSDYLSTRKDLYEILDKFDKKMAKKAYFKHPRAGRLNIFQTLSFLEDHYDRHEKQIYQRLG